MATAGLPVEALRSAISPRPRSDGSGYRLRLEGRAGSTPYRVGPHVGAVAIARVAAQENNILAAMRKHIEALEEKIASQMVRVQQQGDRLREAAFTRVDAKLGNMEALQPKFDRKLAELSGNYKGLSDEMQAQIRHIDQMDTRLWEWRHQMEDEVRNKFSEVEQGQQQLQSALRLEHATSEDSVKRLTTRVRRLESLVEERLGYHDETNQNLAALDARLQEIEASRIQDLSLSATEPIVAVPPLATLAEGTVAALPLAALEVKLAEACQKIEKGNRDAQDMLSRVEAQEERLRSLRTLIDTKEEHFRTNKFDRQDWEARCRELQALTLELDKQRVDHSERLELVQKRLEHHEKAHEEVCDHLRRLGERSYFAMGDGAAADGGEGASSVARAVGVSGLEDLTVLSLEECTARLGAAEEKLESMSLDLQAVRSDEELAPRVAALVEALKQVAPKVMDQEISVRELHEKVAHLETKAALSLEPGKASEANLAARLGRLEAELSLSRSRAGADNAEPV